MHLTEINEVIKASPAIQIQSKITHLQRRAWNVLLANAYNELPNKDIHRVSVAELAKSLGFNSHNEDYLKETLEALVDLHSQVECFRQGQKGKMGRCRTSGIRRDRKRHLHVWFCTASATETLQPSYLHETQPPLAKPVHQPIRPRLVGSLFRLLRYCPKSRRNAVHSHRKIQRTHGTRKG